nr:hypothetical protein BaRGS_009914 [Batillaria attramentaria]
METRRLLVHGSIEGVSGLGHEVVDDELTFPLVFENLAVCLPPKTGSTPFKMIVYYLLQNHTKPFFDVWYRDVHFDIPTAMYQHRSSLKSKTVKAVFVREPYSRLFSAYVDKLFKPRLDNWRM